MQNTIQNEAISLLTDAVPKANIPAPPVTAESRGATANKTVIQIDYVDGIRGILTLAILLAHIRTTLIWIPLQSVNFGLFVGSTIWMWPAFYVVGMFVAMSGYVLMLPVARSSDGWFRGGVGDYLRRRARRMLPPYFAAIALYLLLALIFTGHEKYLLLDRAWGVGSIVTHLTMTHNLFLPYRYSIDAPSWTVAAEWQLYVLFPLILLPLWRRFGIATLLIGSLTLSAIPLLFGGDAVNYHSWFIFVFAAGMTGAAIQYHDRPEENRLRRIVPFGKIALGLYSLFALCCVVDLTLHHELMWQYIPSWKRFLFYETLVGVACVALMVHCGQTGITSAKPLTTRVIKFLTHPVFTAVGLFSYSHYLVHFPILMLIRWMTNLAGLSPKFVILVMYFIAIPLSLAGGYLFFLLVERRFLPSHLRTMEKKA